MRIEIKEIKIYKYETAPEEIQEKIRENLTREFFHFEHVLEERIETLKEFCKLFNTKLDYSISALGNQGDYIKISGLDEIREYQEFKDLLKEDLPLTGCYYDYDLLYSIEHNNLDNYLDQIYKECESMCEHDYILEMCEANQYEFLENGEMY